MMQVTPGKREKNHSLSTERHRIRQGYWNSGRFDGTPKITNPVRSDGWMSCYGGVRMLRNSRSHSCVFHTTLFWKF